MQGAYRIRRSLMSSEGRIIVRNFLFMDKVMIPTTFR